MKIVIITMHRIFNYGSVLQAYATQQLFQRRGHDVELIDYISEERTLRKQLYTIPENVKNDFFHKFFYLFFKRFSIYLKKKTFWRFVENNIHLTKRQYISYQDLLDNPPQGDLYITGSDQVWNSKYNQGIDKGYYLDFTDSDNKVSFVSSFGMTEIPKEEKNETQRLLLKYKHLSVREDSAQSILTQLGMKSFLLLDPTLQLTKEEWRPMASKRLIKEKYVLLMLLYNEDNNATLYARKIADALGVTLVKLSWEMKKPSFVDILMTHRSPEDFLSLFNYAEFIVTNSFHGLAFSINLNKQFIVVERNEFNSRIESLLKLTGLEGRLVGKERFHMDKVLSNIDYQPVNAKLDFERKKAEEYIDLILK